jgi:hypothetical protein
MTLMNKRIIYVYTVKALNVITGVVLVNVIKLSQIDQVPNNQQLGNLSVGDRLLVSFGYCYHFTSGHRCTQGG